MKYFQIYTFKSTVQCKQHTVWFGFTMHFYQKTLSAVPVTPGSNNYL